jgi:hypothetical protein
MRQHLKLHPDSHSVAVASIDVQIAHPRAGVLELSYIVAGQMSNIGMPAAAANVRSDGLWRHTCFEAFIHASPNAGYYELNFSPSGQWAAYQFSSYRRGMRAANEITKVPIEMRSGPDSCALQTSLSLDQFRDLPRDRSWRLGLSAVIEDATGKVSYWALVHPPGKPDFHHADSFACEFSPAVTP